MSWKVAPIGRGGDLLYSQAGTPSLDLRFAENKTLTDYVSGNNLVTFSRPVGANQSPGTYVDENGLIQLSSANTPRFDHDPTTGESLGLLVEESRTNLLAYSEQLNQIVGPVRGTITANALTAPDGTSTADKLEKTESSATYSYVSQSFTQNTAYSFSVYAKAGNTGKILFNDFSTGNSVFFDIATEIVESVGTDWSNANIKGVGSGWYRVSATLTPTTTGTRNVSYTFINATNIGDYVYFWGAQLEEGSFPTSYIPTEGSTVTRAADVASISGANFSSWYNQSEGTVFADCSFLGFTASPVVWSLKDNLNNSNDYIAVFAKTSGQIRYTSNDTSVTQWSKDMVGNVALNTPVKTASAYKINNIAFSVDGASTLTDAAATITTALDRLHLGYIYTGVQQLSGTISRLTYWQTRLPDSTLSTITQ